MSNSVEYTQKRPDGDTLKSTLNFVNEDAADTAVSAMVGALNSLSKNTLTAIERVEGEELQINNPAFYVPNENKYINYENNYSSVFATDNQNIETFRSGDHISLNSSSSFVTVHSADDTTAKTHVEARQGNNVVYNERSNTQFTLRGTSAIYNTADNVSILAEKQNDTLSSSGSNVSLNPHKGDDVATIQGHPTSLAVQYGYGDNTITGFDPAQDFLCVAYPSGQSVSASLNANNNAVVYITKSDSVSSNELVGVSSGTIRYYPYNSVTLRTINIAPYVPEEDEQS